MKEIRHPALKSEQVATQDLFTIAMAIWTRKKGKKSSWIRSLARSKKRRQWSLTRVREREENSNIFEHGFAENSFLSPTFSHGLWAAKKLDLSKRPWKQLTKKDDNYKTEPLERRSAKKNIGAKRSRGNGEREDREKDRKTLLICFQFSTLPSPPGSPCRCRIHLSPHCCFAHCAKKYA